jgi:ribonuclease HII
MGQCELFSTPPVDLLFFEQQALKRGYRIIAGIDEAGRGSLCGPVVAAAVVFPTDLVIPGVNDSKKLSPRTRELLYDEIMTRAVAVGIGMGTPELIDRINILQATRHAMKEAVALLSLKPDMLLIDGISTIDVPLPQKTITKGDSRSLSIAAASIIAKVSRDRMMTELDLLYPGYGFASHKGYGCASHMEAIRRLGPSPVHRLTFRGVREHVPCSSS